MFESTVEGEFIKEKLRKAVGKLFEAGYQLQADAFTALQTLSDKTDPEQVVDKILEKLIRMPQPPVFVDKGLVDEAVSQLHQPEALQEAPIVKVGFGETGKTFFRPYAKDVEARVGILKDPTKGIASKSSVESFSLYFRDRFQVLGKILNQRLDVKGYISIGDALKEKAGSKVKIMGMVSEKVSRGKRIFLRIEDFDHSITVLIQPTKPNLNHEAQNILLDEVVCIVGIKGSEDLIIAEKVIFPDIPYRKPNQSEEPVNAVLTSDFHMGSRFFDKMLFERFISWLSGNVVDEEEKEFIGRIKYLVIAGDLVDGLGLYPQQEKELEIKDIYKQYELVAKYFEQIPDYIQIITIPGNHDATRKALPQPAIPKKFAEPIYGNRNLISLGNPSQITLHGVNILIHHGRSLEDLLVSLPSINRQNVTATMTRLLKARHLAPVYGQKTPIAPEPKDWMVVDSIPDVYHTGHLHVFGYDVYKGVRLLNSGCWQKQTAYQKKLGIVPTYGVVPIINLQTLTLTSMDLTKS